MLLKLCWTNSFLFLKPTVFLFEPLIRDELISEGLVGLCPFNDFRPGKMSQKLCPDLKQTRAQARKVGIDIIISYSCFVFKHLAVAHPVVKDFAATPVSSYQRTEVSGPALQGNRFTGVVVGQLWFGIFFGEVGATHND